MNEPIISPWFFYFADLAGGLSTVCGYLFLISIVLSLLLIVSCLPDEKNESKLTAWLIVICFAVITFFGMASVFIPSTNTCYKMLVASFVTKENINMVANEAKSSIDYILEKIIDTAARMQGLKAESQKEQKETGK